MTTALILAGGDLPEAFIPVAGGVTNRALIRVGPNGETMLDLVAHAVQDGFAANTFAGGRILVAGDVPLPTGCEAVAGGASLVETLMNGVSALRPDETNLLIVTADIPFLTGDAVDDFLRRAEAVRPTAFAYSIIAADICRAAFPRMKRTTLRLAEGEFTGGNLALLDPAFLRENGSVIRDAYARRKDTGRLAGMLGAGTLARLLLSRLVPSLLTIRHVEQAAGRLLRSANPRAVITPFPEIGADIDRPEEITIAREILAKDVETEQ